MRRATAALLGTLAGTALLVGAKYATPEVAGPNTPAGSDQGLDNPSASVDPSLSGSGSPGVSGAAAGASGSPAAGASTPAGARTSAGQAAPPAPVTTTTNPAATCKTTTGNAATIVAPGTGTATVTIKVCGGVISSASATLSQSNWTANDKAIPQLNTLTVQYYKTNMSKITYSSATLTSNSYQTSLKSAMSKAGI